jgi:hypothetical protein
MNDQKKFGAVEIVILSLLVGSEAFAKFVSDLSLVIPGVGEVSFGFVDIYTFIVYGIIIIWFVFKLGAFGTVGITTTVGGVLSLFGIPASLAVCVAIAVYLTNHPKAKQAAGVVTVFEGGVLGEAGAAVEGGELAEEALQAEQAASEASAAAAAAGEGVAAEGQAAAAGAEGAEDAAEAGSRSAPAGAEARDLTPDVEKNPMEVESKRLFEGPTDEVPKPPEPEPTVPSPKNSNARVEKFIKKMEDIQKRTGGGNEQDAAPQEKQEDKEDLDQAA